MATVDPVTPPEVLERRKRTGWKPDAAGRLLYRPKGLLGPGYVVETVAQLDRVEKLERIKATLMVMVGGATIGAFLFPQDGSDDLGVLGALAVVVILVGVLLACSLVGGGRIVRDTAMRAVR